MVRKSRLVFIPLRFLMLVLLVCGSAGRSEAANWPGFRGPEANGVAEKDKLPVRFGPGSNLVWKADALGGHSSPIIWQDQIFLSGADGNKLATTCLDRRTGKKLWEQSVTVEKLERVHSANSHATSTPVTDGKAVYVYFSSFGLIAYSLEGKELWRKPLPMPQTFFDQGTGTSPILAEDKLLVFVQHGNDSHILVLNPVDGREVLKAPMPIHNCSWSTPVSWKENGKSMVGLTCSERFTAFRLADGHEAWWVDGLSIQACSTPVVAGDRLIITAAGVQGEAANVTPPPAFEEALKKYERNGDGKVDFDAIPDKLLFTDRRTSDGQGNMTLKKAFSMFGGVKEGAKLDRENWEAIRKRLVEFGTGPMNQTVVLSVRTGGEKNVSASQVVWKETQGVPEVPSPLAWQGRLYLIRSGGILVCRDLETGKLIYENRIDSPGGYFASPIVADGRIYLASDRGTVTVVKAGDAFEVLAHNELKDPIMASPAVAGNTLYIRSAKQVWAFAEQ